MVAILAKIGRSRSISSRYKGHARGAALNRRRTDEGQPMRIMLSAVSAVLLLSACAGSVSPTASAAHAQDQSATITAALADPRRPATDTDRDQFRHPREVLEFVGLRPGMRIADVGPGGGYYTRLFADIVGPTGHVYGINREPNPYASNPPAIRAVAAQYPNVSVVETGYQMWSVSQPLDVIFISQIYHDFHLAAAPARDATATTPAQPARPALDVAALDRNLFAALRPGGELVVIDHSAVAGFDPANTDQLHRIDQAVVRRELETAGFVFVDEAQFLRNPADARTERVFDADIRGHTDQFVMRFRKPG
jgi:predicted methyltransferase